jgi:hypothetical protein
MQMTEEQIELAERRDGLAQRIEEWEDKLADLPKNTGSWYHLAHARSEWSMGMYDVAERDLARVAALEAALPEAAAGGEA